MKTIKRGIEIEVKEDKLTIDLLQERINHYGSVEKWVENFDEHNEVYKWENIDEDVKDYIIAYGDFIPAELECITTVDKKKINNFRYSKGYGAFMTTRFRSFCRLNGKNTTNINEILSSLKIFMNKY